MNWRERIVNDPRARYSKLRVRNTKVSVSKVLASLAGGLSHKHILSLHRSLTEDDILACLAYAAELTGERIIDLRMVEQFPPALHEMVVELVRQLPRSDPTDDDE